MPETLGLGPQPAPQGGEVGVVQHDGKMGAGGGCDCLQVRVDVVEVESVSENRHHLRWWRGCSRRQPRGKPPAPKKSSNGISRQIGLATAW